MGLGEAAWSIVQGVVGMSSGPANIFQPEFPRWLSHRQLGSSLSIAVYGYRKSAILYRSSVSPVFWWAGMGSALGIVLIAMIFTSHAEVWWLAQATGGS